jgi:hypothetical protein
MLVIVSSAGCCQHFALPVEYADLHVSCCSARVCSGRDTAASRIEFWLCELLKLLLRLHCILLITLVRGMKTKMRTVNDCHE